MRVMCIFSRHLIDVSARRTPHVHPLLDAPIVSSLSLKSCRYYEPENDLKIYEILKSTEVVWVLRES